MWVDFRTKKRTLYWGLNSLKHNINYAVYNVLAVSGTVRSISRRLTYLILREFLSSKYPVYLHIFNKETEAPKLLAESQEYIYLV